MMLARVGDGPNDCTYFCTSGPIADTEPASARPKPSRIDFLPSSITSAGMSSYFVPTMNSATDLVSPGDLGNSGAGAEVEAAPVAGPGAAWTRRARGATAARPA